MIKDIKNSPYANWLEDMCAATMEQEPVIIGICMMAADGTVLTSYYGDISHEDKAFIAHHIYLDSVMDMVMANAADVIKAAEEAMEEEEEAEND